MGIHLASTLLTEISGLVVMRENEVQRTFNKLPVLLVSRNVSLGETSHARKCRHRTGALSRETSVRLLDVEEIGEPTLNRHINFIFLWRGPKRKE